MMTTVHIDVKQKCQQVFHHCSIELKGQKFDFNVNKKRGKSEWKGNFDTGYPFKNFNPVIICCNGALCVIFLPENTNPESC